MCYDVSVFTFMMFTYNYWGLLFCSLYKSFENCFIVYHAATSNTVHCRAVSLAPWPAHVYHCVATDLGSTYSYYHPVWRSLVLRASVCLSECISVHTWSLLCTSICTYLEFIVYEHLYILGVYCVRASVHTWSLLCTSICTCRVMSYLPT